MRELIRDLKASLTGSMKPTVVVRVWLGDHWRTISAFGEDVTSVDLVEALQKSHPGCPIEVLRDRIGGGS